MVQQTIVSQGTILPELEFRFLLYQKGKGLWLVVVNFLVPEFFVLAVVHVGVATVFL